MQDYPFCSTVSMTVPSLSGVLQSQAANSSLQACIYLTMAHPVECTARSEMPSSTLPPIPVTHSTSQQPCVLIKEALHTIKAYPPSILRKVFLLKHSIRPDTLLVFFYLVQSYSTPFSPSPLSSLAPLSLLSPPLSPHLPPSLHFPFPPLPPHSNWLANSSPPTHTHMTHSSRYVSRNTLHHSPVRSYSIPLLIAGRGGRLYRGALGVLDFCFRGTHNRDYFSLMQSKIWHTRNTHDTYRDYTWYVHAYSM